ncbi:related to pre-mrna splicing factor srp55 [Sporisorium reilianum SRZ2]|uniref:Related to pre-mrna splicing factor srp55 n=1 Tax=Sporisorium reilianum (strain SRZ2) TaxID=999809 RepID=E6ZQN3_SPORE|nr:related to pre-mrna splicing factor srp55 [Sporisorium reilianum SRZ2]
MSTRVYIGKLPADVRRGDIEDLFRDYGRLYDVRIMGSFGFVEFEHPRDAEDAVKDFDGKNFMGERILVQHAKSGERRRAEPAGYASDPYDRRGGARDAPSSRYGAPPPPRREPRLRRGQFRCVISNLPPNTSWQDLKDIGREHGSISFADVDPNNPDEGFIEYDNRDDYERALDKIEGIELRGNKLRIDPAPRDDRDRSPPSRRRDDSPPPRRRDDSREPRDRADSREPVPERNGRFDSRSPLPPRDD